MPPFQELACSAQAHCPFVLVTPELLLRLLQPPDGFELALTTVLASYINYPIFGDEERCLVIKCLAAMARAAANVPTICFAACLPQFGGEEDLAETRQSFQSRAAVQICALWMRCWCCLSANMSCKCMINQIAECELLVLAGKGVDPAVRQQLVRPFLDAMTVPEPLFKSSCELLLAAVYFHPSLQGILLADSILQASSKPSRVSCS